MKKQNLAIVSALVLLGTLSACTPKTTQQTPSATKETTGTQQNTLVNNPSDPAGETALMRSVMAMLITTKEKNFAKQYDKLLCDECKTIVTAEEYTKIWDSELSSVPLKNVTFPKGNAVTYEDNFSVTGIEKPYARVAKISPQYLLADEAVYTAKNKAITTLYFIEGQDKIWRLLWWKKQ